ncbi:MAG: imidazole glycerol phosphate synthase subunit HisH [Firmicutes bacterium HGW-Firmicutes-12]|nr:MAG: imidazole glycerol phosphate synthase subunit HisH [Firmicutes bacterium HGW-Firmicutes-12]
MKTAVLDYDVGNLASVIQGLKYAGLQPVLTRDRDEILSAKAVVLPGVGAFGQGMENLRKYNLLSIIDAVTSKGTPFLGICLGMQLLFHESDEYGSHSGLGLLPGKVVRFPAGLKIPHMGWNTLNILNQHPFLEGIQSGSYVYFVHSYIASDCEPSHIVANTDYGVDFPAMVCLDNIVGVQFHPEKSSRIGLKLLSNFGEMVRNGSNSGY